MRIDITLLFLVFLHISVGVGNLCGQILCHPDLPVTGGSLAIDFSTLSPTVHKDLAKWGFSLEKQMQDEKAIFLGSENGRLNISASDQAFGFMVKKDLHIDQPHELEIEWGVGVYPPEADWRSGHNYEPLMVVVFFGEPLPSDNLFLPDMPLFMGLFLGRHEPSLSPFISKNYTKTGKYVCMGNPEPGQMITSRLDLAKAFHLWFGDREMPPVTGIAIEVDTGELAGSARSSAFIKNISLGRAD